MYVSAYAPFGSEGILIRVEVDIRRGIPGLISPGLRMGRFGKPGNGFARPFEIPPSRSPPNGSW